MSSKWYKGNVARGVRELTSLMLSVALTESFKGSINLSSRFPPAKSVDMY
jgi:hypothetical protein